MKYFLSITLGIVGLLIILMVLVSGSNAITINSLKIGDCIENDRHTYKILEIGQFSVKTIRDDNEQSVLNNHDLEHMYRIDCFGKCEGGKCEL